MALHHVLLEAAGEALVLPGGHRCTIGGAEPLADGGRVVPQAGRRKLVLRIAEQFFQPRVAGFVQESAGVRIPRQGDDGARTVLKLDLAGLALRHFPRARRSLAHRRRPDVRRVLPVEIGRGAALALKTSRARLVVRCDQLPGRLRLVGGPPGRKQLLFHVRADVQRRHDLGRLGLCCRFGRR